MPLSDSSSYLHTYIGEPPVLSYRWGWRWRYSSFDCRWNCYYYDFFRLISNLLKSGYGIHVSLHLQITFALIWPTSTIYSIQPFEQVLLDHHGECSSHKVNYVWNLNQFHFDYTLKTLQRDNMNDRAHMPTKYIRG